MKGLAVRGLDWLSRRPGWGFLSWGLLMIAIADAAGERDGKETN